MPQVPPTKKPCTSIEVAHVDVGADLVTRQVAPCSMLKCKGQCCRFGAMVELTQARQIDQLLPRLLPLMRPEARRVVRRLGWSFRGTVQERYAHTLRAHTASRVVQDRCVFVQDQEHGGCLLHALALEDNVPVLQYKPPECVLFPLNGVQDGQLHVHTWQGYPCTTDHPSHPAAYESLSHELQIVLGDAGYQTLKSQIDALKAEGIPFESDVPPDPPPVSRGRPPAPPDTGNTP